MAFGTPVAGTVAYSASGGTSVAPSYPASIVSTDQLVLIVGQKPSTANSGTVTTPSGWTLREELTAAGGYSVTLGADTGNTNLRFYTKDTVTGSESGTLTVTVGTNNVCWAFILRVPTAGGTISYGSTEVAKTGAGNINHTFAANPGLTAGDIAIWAMCIPTDVTTPTQFAAHTISATGATFATPTEFNEPDSGTGNDIGGFSAWATVSTGTATAAPTITATVGGTNTNARGPIVLLRMRETLPTRTGSLDATETGSDTFSGTGDVIVSGALAATSTGSDSFAASGAVTDPAITGTLSATETGADAFSGAGDVFVRGALSAAETGADAFSAAGDVFVRGALSATEAGTDALAVTGDVFVKGALAVTESGSDTFAATGTVAFPSITGALSVAEAGADTLAAAGDVFVRGSLAVAETGGDSLASAGDVFVRGDLAATSTGSDSFAGTGDVIVLGSVAATESGADTFAGSGSTIAGGVAGSLSATEAGVDALAAAGGVRVSGSVAATDSPDALAATGRVIVAGALAAQEVGQDSFLADQLVIRAVGALAATETGADRLSSPDGYWQHYAESGYTVADQVGRVFVRGAGAATEGALDSAALVGDVFVRGSMAAIEIALDTMKAGIIIGRARSGATARRREIAQTREVDETAQRAALAVQTRGDYAGNRPGQQSMRRQ